MARRYKKPKTRIPMKGDTADMFAKTLVKEQEKKVFTPMEHPCCVCGYQHASLGIQDKWYCYDHWVLTASYQDHIFRQFLTSLEDE